MNHPRPQLGDFIVCAILGGGWGVIVTLWLTGAP